MKNTIKNKILLVFFFMGCFSVAALANPLSQVCSHITGDSERPHDVSLTFSSGMSGTLVTGYRLKLLYDTDHLNPLLITEGDNALHIREGAPIVTAGGGLACMRAGGIGELVLNLTFVATEKYGIHEAKGCTLGVKGVPYIQKAKSVEKSVSWDPENAVYVCHSLE